MRYFVTKYAVSSGFIYIKECQSPDGKYAYSVERYRQQFVIGSDAFEHEADAVAAANAARLKKIASLKKQIAKLEKMTFEVKP